MSTRTKIGSVSVDSGQLMIVDPCYIDSTWDSKPPPGKKHHSASYLECMDATLSSEGYGPVLRFRDNVTGLALAFNTQYGDGDYDIFATKSDDGRLEKVEIVLSPADDVESLDAEEEEDYEDEYDDDDYDADLDDPEY